MKADDIARYLQDHPQFFEDYHDLLAQLYVPHPHGGRTISITERQILTLREKAKALELKLAELLRFGEDNDLISTRVHALSVALMTAGSFEAVMNAPARATGRSLRGAQSGAASVEQCADPRRRGVCAGRRAHPRVCQRSKAALLRPGERSGRARLVRRRRTGGAVDGADSAAPRDAHGRSAGAGCDRRRRVSCPTWARSIWSASANCSVLP
jgi:hypothetical protein